MVQIELWLFFSKKGAAKFLDTIARLLSPDIAILLTHIVGNIKSFYPGHIE